MPVDAGFQRARDARGELGVDEVVTLVLEHGQIGHRRQAALTGRDALGKIRGDLEDDQIAAGLDAIVHRAFIERNECRVFAFLGSFDDVRAQIHGFAADASALVQVDDPHRHALHGAHDIPKAPAIKRREKGRYGNHSRYLDKHLGGFAFPCPVTAAYQPHYQLL